MMTLSGKYWDGEEGGPDYNPIERIEHGLKYLRSREFEREEELHRGWLNEALKLISWYCRSLRICAPLIEFLDLPEFDEGLPQYKIEDHIPCYKDNYIEVAKEFLAQ
jgi:hypothetical protein